jgi:hypothetical protein
MKLELQIESLSWKILPLLFFIIFYWFYMSICCGYFLSKIFFNFLKIFRTSNFFENFKSIKFRKKFNLKNIIKIITNFFWNFIINWLSRIYNKTLVLIDAVVELIRLVQIILKKSFLPVVIPMNLNNMNFF